MSPKKGTQFSRREREIMEIIYQKGEATAKEVMDELVNPPGYSSVRSHLTLLEKKGHLTHRIDKLTYIYRPSVAVDKAGKSALKEMLKTFFDNSVESSIAAILDLSTKNLTEEELDRISKMIDDEKKKRSK